MRILLPALVLASGLACYEPPSGQDVPIPEQTRPEVPAAAGADDAVAPATTPATAKKAQGAPPKAAKPPKSRYAGTGKRSAATGKPFEVANIDEIRVASDVVLEPGTGAWGNLVQCDPLQGSPMGQVWASFGDDQCWNGVSVSYLDLQHTGWDGLGCTMRWAGRISDRITVPFAGFGVDLDRDMRQAKTVVMEVRGDANTYRAELVLKAQLDAVSSREKCDSVDYDFYGTDFVCGDGTDAWKEVTLTIDALEQRGFGTVYAMERDMLEKFQIVTTKRSPHDFECDVRVLRVE